MRDGNCCRHRFSKVLFTLALYSKCTRALTVENFGLQNMAFNCASHCSLFVSYELFKSLSSFSRARPACPSSSVEEVEAVGREMGARAGGAHSADQQSSAHGEGGQGVAGNGVERGDYAAMWHYMAVASAGAGAGIVQVWHIYYGGWLMGGDRPYHI